MIGFKLLYASMKRALIDRHADLVAEVFGDLLDEAPESGLVVANQQSFVLHFHHMLRSLNVSGRHAAW